MAATRAIASSAPSRAVDAGRMVENRGAQCHIRRGAVRAICRCPMPALMACLTRWRPSACGHAVGLRRMSPSDLCPLHQRTLGARLGDSGRYRTLQRCGDAFRGFLLQSRLPSCVPFKQSGQEFFRSDDYWSGPTNFVVRLGQPFDDLPIGNVPAVPRNQIIHIIRYRVSKMGQVGGGRPGKHKASSIFPNQKPNVAYKCQDIQVVNDIHPLCGVFGIAKADFVKYRLRHLNVESIARGLPPFVRNLLVCRRDQITAGPGG